MVRGAARHVNGGGHEQRIACAYPAWRSQRCSRVALPPLNRYRRVLFPLGGV
jgi:hypothetical protein